MTKLVTKFRREFQFAVDTMRDTLVRARHVLFGCPVKTIQTIESPGHVIRYCVQCGEIHHYEQLG